MKGKFLLLPILTLASYSSLAQAFTLSGGYSPTFESLNFGVGLGDEVYLMDFQIGLSDEFLGMGGDIQFAVTNDLASSSYDLVNIYIGGGGEIYLMDDYNRDSGYSIYGMASISYNLVVLSYGYGFYDYDGEPISGLEGFHKVKLTLILGEVI